MKFSKIATLVAAATALMASTVHAASALDGAKLAWSNKHTGLSGFTSEVVSFDSLTKTLWVAGVSGVQVLDAKTGDALQFINTSGFGSINSIAIHNGVAAFAIEASGDRRNDGVIKLYDTGTRGLLAGTNSIAVGALPDMLTFTPNGSKLLVANEGTPNAVSATDKTPYAGTDPKGSVSIIDMGTRSVAATVQFDNVAPTASNRVWAGQSLVRQPGMDIEPEYIAVSRDGSKAFVTLQEHNAVATIDLATHKTVSVVGLGAKDFNKVGNEIDVRDNSTVSFQNVAVRGLYMPDGIASFDRKGKTYYVIANEGDFREDDVDRKAAGGSGLESRLRISGVDTDALYAAGARSISIRDADGNEVWDSGASLDKAAHAAGLYDDGRSRDKGVEPEDVKVMEIGDRLYAFVGLERTTTGAIGVFDISDPVNASFVTLLKNPSGFNRPEGLTTFEMDGFHYLAVASEGSGGSSSDFGTTVFQLAPVPEPGTWALMGLGLAALAGVARRQRRA
ncbi:choice-of-anchor I family protein [Roseateles sp.]|uniref:choice-of-anchor I family protein n=1 Tax=Roseateles sp. TaxID=1971397 RepID=UPI003BA6D702